jgi:hypothetical protein
VNARVWPELLSESAQRPASLRPGSILNLGSILTSCQYIPRIVPLLDLLDLRVMLDVPYETRSERLRQREGEHSRAEWEARWASAEEYYFKNVMPPEAFNLVIRSEAGYAIGAPPRSRF